MRKKYFRQKYFLPLVSNGVKISEFRQKPKNELQGLLIEKRERLRALRFDLASGKVKNVREVRKIKKDIAQILTLLKQL